MHERRKPVWRLYHIWVIISSTTRILNKNVKFITPINSTIVGVYMIHITRMVVNSLLFMGNFTTTRRWWNQQSLHIFHEKIYRIIIINLQYARFTWLLTHNWGEYLYNYIIIYVCIIIFQLWTTSISDPSLTYTIIHIYFVLQQLLMGLNITYN